MLMGKQMILTIFIISIAFGAKTKFQIRIVQLCSPTNGTFVACDTFRLLYLTVICPLPVYFLRWNTAIIARCKEENQEIQDRGNNGNSAAPTGNDHFINDQCRINTCHPLHLDRNDKIQHNPHIRITHRKCEENCHIDIVCAEAAAGMGLLCDDAGWVWKNAGGICSLF